MPYIQQSRDLTKQYLSFGRNLSDYRPIANALYLPGTNCNLVPLDQQVYPDQGTVQPTPIVVAQQGLVCGVVSEVWQGFSPTNTPTNALQTPTFQSPNSILTARGTQGVLLVVRGHHPGVLVDTTAGVAIGNGTFLIPSATTAGYAQGATTVPSLAMSTIGGAMLPAAGLGSVIGSGSLAQASQTATIAGTVTAGDVLTLTLQYPYSPTNPGVPQTQNFSYVVLPAQTATTAGTAFANQLNGNAGFSQFYTASSAAGVMTIAVNALATPFLITVGSGNIVTGQWAVSLSGSVGNSITFAAAKTGPGATTFVAGGATLAGGVGFKGYLPAFITGADC